MEILSYPSLLGLFVIIISLSLHWFFLWKKQPQTDGDLPPGRTGLPFIGESLEFLSTGWKGHPEKFIFDRIMKYSSNVFRSHIYGTPAIFFCGPAGNKFLFSNHSKLVEIWFPSALDKVLVSPNQYLANKKDKFKHILSAHMQPRALLQYIGVIDKMTQRHFVSNWENKSQVTVASLVRKHTFHIACCLLLSVEDPDHIAKFQAPFEVLVAGMVSLPINIPGTPFHRALKASNTIRKLALDICKQRRLNVAQDKNYIPKQDIMSDLLSTCDEDGKFMAEEGVADKILALLVAGVDTLTAAISSTLMYLAEFPEIYQRVYSEQMEISDSKTEGELLNWEDISKMKYSWNVVCEALRLASPAQGSFREAITDFKYSGFQISKGHKIFWSTQSCHMNPEYFPDPLKFDPSRFEGSGPAPYTFVPFGGGPRMCPGKEYSRLEILVFIHHLVRRFKWEKVNPDEKIVVDPISKPEKGLIIYLYPHN